MEVLGRRMKGKHECIPLVSFIHLSLGKSSFCTAPRALLLNWQWHFPVMFPVMFSLQGLFSLHKYYLGLH